MQSLTVLKTGDYAKCDKKGARAIKQEEPIEIIVHYPETEEMQRELAKQIALVHAQAVMEKIRMLPCPLAQKLQLIDAVMARRREKNNGADKSKDRT